MSPPPTSPSHRFPFCQLFAAALLLFGVALPAPAAQTERAPAKSWVLTRVRIFPDPASPGGLAGARVAGSSQSPTNGFVGLAPIPEKAGSDGWIDLPVPADRVFPYLKIEGTGACKLALGEVEFYAGDRKLEGKGFGTAGATPETAEHFRRALDGDPSTAFVAPIENAYVGIELPGESRVPGVIFEPRGGNFPGPFSLKIRVWPPGPTIVYTTDGSAPTRENGQTTTETTLEIARTTSVAAFAHQEGRADGPMDVQTFFVGATGAEVPAIKTYHIGNSLTDTTKNRLDAICRSGGHPITTYYKTIPGCSLLGNWEGNAKGFGYPQGWANDYLKVAELGIDHLFLQHFPNPQGLTRDGKAGGEFLALFRRHNPDVQGWVYSQWPDEPIRDPKSGKLRAPYNGRVGGESWNPGEPVPWDSPIAADAVRTWDDAVTNYTAYSKALLAKLNTEYPGNKPLRLIPSAEGLLRVRKAVEAGRFKGYSDYAAFALSDPIHLTPRAAYFVCALHYACLFGESPEGKVTWAHSGLPKEEAQLLQRIAWETALAVPETGVKP